MQRKDSVTALKNGADIFKVRRAEKTVPRAFWTLKTAEKWLAGYAFSGAFRDDPGVDSSCRLYSKNNKI